MPTYTTQPSDTDGLDTYIASGSGANYGTENIIAIGEGAGVVYRGLLKFNFSVGTNIMPIGSHIASAVLSLTPVAEYSSNARVLSCYQCYRNWSETTSNWTVYSTGNSWGTAGAANTTTDRSGTAMGTLNVLANPVLNTPLDITLTTATVQGWFDGSISNYGMIIQVATEDTDKVNWASSGHATAGYRPKLTCVYTNAIYPNIIAW